MIFFSRNKFLSQIIPSFIKYEQSTTKLLFLFLSKQLGVQIGHLYFYLVASIFQGFIKLQYVFQFTFQLRRRRTIYTYFLGKSLNKDAVVQSLPYVHPLYGLVASASLVDMYIRHGSLQFHNMAAIAALYFRVRQICQKLKKVFGFGHRFFILKIVHNL